MTSLMPLLVVVVLECDVIHVQYLASLHLTALLARERVCAALQGSVGLAHSTGRVILDRPLMARYIRGNRTRDLLEVLQQACTKIDA